MPYLIETFDKPGHQQLRRDTRAEAERFIADDPFSRVQLFERVTITRWRKAYLAGQCFL